MDLTQETIDYVALRRLQDAYADIVTRRAWSELHDIFVPDIDVIVDTRRADPIVMTGPDAVSGFISGAIARFDFFEFVILNARVWLRHDGDNDLAVGRMYISELRRELGTGSWTASYGVYHDRYARIDGQWWFTRRRYHSLARTPPEDAAFEFPSGDLL
jgi:hypothetical protein